MNKKMIIAIIALVAALALVGGIWLISQNGNNDNGGSKTTTGTDAAGNVVTGASFTVVVVHGSGEEKTFTYTTQEDKLGAVLESEGLIVADEANPGMFHTVDGEKADWNENQSYWAFYIGEDYAMTGIYDTSVADGITYKLVYTIG